MSTEDRSRILVNRLFKEIIKDIKDRGDEEPMDTIKNIEELLDLAKTIALKGIPEVVDLTQRKKRKYTRKVKPVLPDLVDKPE